MSLHVEQFNNLLNAYSVEHGLGKITLSKQGTYRLSFAGDLVVNIDVLTQSATALIYSEITPLPAGADLAFFQALLQANFPGHSLRHNSLAINEQKTNIILLRALPVQDLQLAVFNEVLENFTNAAQQWRDKGLNQMITKPAKANSDQDKFQDKLSGSFIRG